MTDDDDDVTQVKFFTLKNPSSHPVSVELRPLASYSAPLGALDLLTKWFNISPLSVNVTATEFTLLEGSGQVRSLLWPPPPYSSALHCPKAASSP